MTIIISTVCQGAYGEQIIFKMGDLALTEDEILQDIETFNQQIETAKSKLSALPVNVATWKERKKVRTTRNALVNEIEHVRRMIGYAQEALIEFE